MNKTIGLWIDHRETVMVVLTPQGEETRRLESGAEKRAETTQEVTAEDMRDRKFTNSLNKYYDGVIAHIHEADSILIFGPGEAKGELEKRLEIAGLKGHIVGVETVDKMTDRQIAAKVREHFNR